MIAYSPLRQLFIGQVMGTSVGTHVFVKYGWRAGAGLNMAFYGFQLLVLLLRGPHCKQHTWFGYEGGLEARKSVVDERKRLEAGEASSSEKVNNQDVIEKKNDDGDAEKGEE